MARDTHVIKFSTQTFRLRLRLYGASARRAEQNCGARARAPAFSDNRPRVYIVSKVRRLIRRRRNRNYSVARRLRAANLSTLVLTGKKEREKG